MANCQKVFSFLPLKNLIFNINFKKSCTLMTLIIKKLLSLLVAFSLIAPSLFQYDQIKVNAADQILKRKKLVAVLVDDNIFADSIVNFEMKKWAAWIWTRMRDTNVVIYKLGDSENEQGIFEKLEKMYFSWVVSDNSYEESYLDWIILVWNIPLANVQLKEYTTVKESVFPYTDFENKYFVFDKEKWYFARQTEIVVPKSEVWHWIIRPKQNEINEVSFYANYFKKLNSYYAGEIENQENILFIDLNEERKSLNQDLLKQYNKSINFDFHIVYKKFSSSLLNSLLGDFWGWIKDTKYVKLNRDLIKKIDNDIFSVHQIKKLLPEYFHTVKWYTQKVNDFIDYSWKWDIESWDTIPKLITVKDYYGKNYIKNINDYLNNRIIDFVKLHWEKRILVEDVISKAEDCSRIRWTPSDDYLSKQIEVSSWENNWEQSTSQVDIWWLPTYKLCKTPRINPKAISSVVVHNQPTQEMIDFITDSPRAMAIPVDWRHIVSFQWRRWEVRLFLPNLFKADDLPWYMESYKKYFNGVLKRDVDSIDTPEFEEWISDDVEKKLNYYMQWRMSNLNEKHREILLEYWFWKDFEKFPWENSIPYEFLYLRSEKTDFDSISFESFGEEELKPFPGLDYFEGLDATDESEVESDLEMKCWSINWVPLHKWFAAIKCWIEDIKDFEYEECGPWWDLDDFAQFKDEFTNQLEQFWKDLTDVIDLNSEKIEESGDVSIDIFPNKIVSVKWKSESIVFQLLDENGNSIKHFTEITVWSSSWIDIINKDINSEKPWVQIAYFWTKSELKVKWNEYWNWSVKLSFDSWKSVNINVDIIDKISFKLKLKEKEGIPEWGYNIMFFDIETVDSAWYHVDYNWVIYLSASEKTTLLSDNILYVENGKVEAFASSQKTSASFLISSNYLTPKKVNLEFNNTNTANPEEVDNNNDVNMISVFGNEIENSNFISAYLIWNDFADQDNWIVYDLLSNDNAIVIASNLNSKLSEVYLSLKENWSFELNKDSYAIWISNNSRYEFYSYDQESLLEIGRWKMNINEGDFFQKWKLNVSSWTSVSIDSSWGNDLVYFDDLLLAKFWKESFSIFNANIESIVTSINSWVLIDFYLFWEMVFSLELSSNWISEVSDSFEYSYWRYDIMGSASNRSKKKWTEKDYFWNWFSQDEKAVLKMAWNQSFWESLKSENWVFSVVVWDPTFNFKIDEDFVWYDETIWEELLSWEGDILEIHTIDYNNNGGKDIIYYDTESKLNLLERLYDWSFINRGSLAYFFDFANSILVKDVDEDGDEDILVALENWRLKYLQNQDWKFINDELSFDVNAKSIRYFESHDMDKDWKDDFIIANSKAQILIFYWWEAWKYKIIYSLWEIEGSERLEFFVNKKPDYPEIIVPTRRITLVPIWSWRMWYSIVPFPEIDESDYMPKLDYWIDDLIEINKDSFWIGRGKSQVDENYNIDEQLDNDIAEVNEQLSDLVDDVSGLTCRKWWCVNSPLNYAFLAPWKNTIMAQIWEAVWIQFGAMAWTPIFWYWLFACTSPSWVCPMPCFWAHCFTASTWWFRMYLTPTVTWGLWFSYCAWHNNDATWEGSSSECFITTLPIESICEDEDDKDKSFLDIIPSESKINNTIQKFNSSKDSSYPDFVSNRKGEDVGDSYWFWLDGFEPKIYGPDNNRTVKGFSKTFLSDWWDKQLEEIYNVDFPILHLITPDTSGSANFWWDTFSPSNLTKGPEYKESNKTGDISNKEDSKAFISNKNSREWARNIAQGWDNLSNKIKKPLHYVETGLDNYFSEIEKIPFLTLKREKITLIVPWPGFSRLLSSILAMENWVADSWKEIADKWKALGSIPGCAGIDVKNMTTDTNNTKKCEEAKDIIDATELVKSVEREVETLKSYLTFYEQLAKYQYWVALYIDQVISIVDCFTDLLWWWYKRNRKIVKKYYEFYYTLKGFLELMKDFTLIYEGYQKWCEPCKSNTYLSNFSLAKIFFSLIPTPPIVEMPKVPDLVFDLSDVQFWVEIPIPDLNFKVKELIFDLDLPPLEIWNLKLPTLPHFPQLPELPELPELPSIDVPKLPDLPPPPKLPELPWILSDISESVRLAFKLYCLIFDQWLFIYEEWQIKQIVEWLTSRSSSIMLPADFNFLQIPNATYKTIKEVNVSTHFQYQIEPWKDLYKSLKEKADDFNSIESDLRREMYRFDFWAWDAIDSLQQGIDDNTENLQNKIDNDDQSYHKPKFDNLTWIKNELLAYRSDLMEDVDNLFKEKDFINWNLESDNSSFSSLDDENLITDNNKISLDSSLSPKLLGATMDKTNIKSLESQLSSFKGIRIPRPTELRGWAWFIFAIWKSLFIKHFYWFNRDIVQKEVWIKDFDSININRRAVNLFKSKRNDWILALQWEDEDDISGYIIEILDKIDWFDNSRNEFSSKLIYLIYKGDLPLDLFAKLKQQPNSKVFTREFDDSVLELELNKDWYFSRITPLTQNWKLWNLSNQSLIYSKDVWQLRLIRSETKVRRLVPVLMDYNISIWEEGDIVSWDLDWDDSFESIWSEVEIGARQELETFTVKAHITNYAKWTALIQDVEIESYSPEITIFPEFQDRIVGKINPEIANYPVSFLINDSDLSLFWEVYYTDDTWKFDISRNQIKSYKRIYDSNWNTIAKLDLLNKKISPEQSYGLKVRPSSNWQFSRVEISGWWEIFANVYTKVWESNITLVSESLDSINENWKIYIRDLNTFDDIKTNKVSWGLTFDDAILINDKWKKLVLISKTWEIKTFNWTQIRIKRSASSSFVFEVIVNGNILVFEFYIWVDLNEVKRVSSIEWVWYLEEEFVPFIAANEAPSLSLVKQVDFSWKSKEVEDFLDKWILPFWDVSVNDPARNAILELYRRNIVNGYHDKTFRPTRKISRAEFVKIVLWATQCEDCTRPSSEEKDEFQIKPFPDVSIYDWFFYCISKAKKLKMVTWYLSDWLFRPHKNISRWEAVAILLRQASIEINSFSWAINDVVEDHWFKDYVQTAVDIGLINQIDWNVKPLEEITRWEFALITTRLLSLLDCQKDDKDDNWILDYKEKDNWLWNNKWDDPVDTSGLWKPSIDTWATTWKDRLPDNIKNDLLNDLDDIKKLLDNGDLLPLQDLLDDLDDDIWDDLKNLNWEPVDRWNAFTEKYTIEVVEKRGDLIGDYLWDKSDLLNGLRPMIDDLLDWSLGLEVVDGYILREREVIIENYFPDNFIPWSLGLEVVDGYILREREVIIENYFPDNFIPWSPGWPGSGGPGAGLGGTIWWIPDDNDIIPISDIIPPDEISPIPEFQYEPVSCVFIEDLSDIDLLDGWIKIFGIIVSDDKNIIFSKSKDFVE